MTVTRGSCESLSATSRPIQEIGLLGCTDTDLVGAQINHLQPVVGERDPARVTIARGQIEAGAGIRLSRDVVGVDLVVDPIHHMEAAVGERDSFRLVISGNQVKILYLHSPENERIVGNVRMGTGGPIDLRSSIIPIDGIDAQGERFSSRRVRSVERAPEQRRRGIAPDRIRTVRYVPAFEVGVTSRNEKNRTLRRIADSEGVSLKYTLV